MIIVQIVIGVRLLTLASLRSDGLLFLILSSPDYSESTAVVERRVSRS